MRKNCADHEVAAPFWEGYYLDTVLKDSGRVYAAEDPPVSIVNQSRRVGKKDCAKVDVGRFLPVAIAI